MTTLAKKKPRNWRKLLWTCIFEFENRRGEKEQGKGRTMEVDGVPLDLFPIGVLCAMLHRGHKCIYKWEKEFGFPRSLWRIRDDATTNRWYSRKQLAAIRIIYEKFGRLQKDKRGQLRNFIAAVRSIFYSIDAPIIERKPANEQQLEGLRSPDAIRDRGATRTA